MERYICIHCHFYQPPRENPWLEAVEQQDSAYPFHDWNERITAECYAPNTASRILGPSGRITQIFNNYAHISFNFGPTLLSWMEEKAPSIYQRILDADRQGAERFSGHGSAVAQAYNHMILPLATRRDKETQVIWGIRDFEHRFGRRPEGLWLPETAADIESLEVLAAEGLKYTILAPHQAKLVRKHGSGGRWKNIEGGRIDPTRPYLCRLPGGKEITIFFYDGPISRAVAFEGLLSNGEGFAQRLLSGFSTQRNWPQLMHIATDGETYGHHHKYGDMALAYALRHIEANKLARITNYGEYLEKHPPTHEAEIVSNTSWSCAHGVERWKSDCGCNSGMKAGWNQKWRAPLRAALDQLRDDLLPVYQKAASELLKNPSIARDAYINVILDRSRESLDKFFEQHAHHPLSEEERTRALNLLEMQRHAMLMYTSCGWFFDELSGIETVQVVMYAGRALQLAVDLFGDGFENRFLEKLALASSNLAEFGNGADIYQRWVKPAQLSLLNVGAHYAITSLFDGYPQHRSIYCYDVDLYDVVQRSMGRGRLAVGHAKLCSRVTLECADVTFGALHFGDHNVDARVRHFDTSEHYQVLKEETVQTSEAADFPAMLQVFNRRFEDVTYGLRSLFRDEQRRILNQILRTTLSEADAAYRQIYDHHAALMTFLANINVPFPHILRVTSEFVLNSRLRAALSAETIDRAAIEDLFATVRREQIQLDADGLSWVLKKSINRLTDSFAAEPSLARLTALDETLGLLELLPFEVDLWRSQNTYFELLKSDHELPNELRTPEAQRLLTSVAGRLRLEISATPAEEEMPLAV